MVRSAKKVMVFWSPLVFFLASWSVCMANTTASPEQVVKGAMQRLLSALQAERAIIDDDPSRIYALVEEIVLEHVDVQRMSRWVLGKHWRRATPGQRQEFVSQFQTLLLRTYGTAFASHSGQGIKYLPAVSQSGGRGQLVRMEIERPGAKPIPLTFSLHAKHDRWLVYDIKIDAVSLIANYRSNFSSMIRKVGIDGLISHLASHNHKLLAAL